MNYKKYLTEEILPYWLRISPDKECGGVFTKFNSDGNVNISEKDVWFHGRAMWTYSLAYRLCEKKQEYLDICEHIFRFYEKCTLPGFRLPYKCDREGKPMEIREVYYYSEMFAVMGCAQYYRICKKQEVFDLADHFFDTVFDLYKKNRHTTQEINVDVECKTFGLHMAMLATAQFMRNIGINFDKYDEAVRMSIDEMMNGGFVDDENRCVNEYVSMSGERLSGDLGEVSVPGHIYEAAWFVLCEGEVKNDDIIRNFGKKLVDYSMPEGFEKVTDVIPTSYSLADGFEKSLGGEYLNWPQQEATIAFRLAHNIFGDEKYLELSNMFEDVWVSYYDRFSGSIWLRNILKEDGEYINPVKKSAHIQGPFHFERVLLALGTLQETGKILEYME